MAVAGTSELAARQGASVLYTWTAQQDAVPFEIVGGEGARFRTADGAEWLDFGSMTWNANLGHAHPAMRTAMVRAAERGMLTYPSSVFPEKAAAGERLLSVAPEGLRDGKTFICLSGAEANENAVKIARQFTGRRRVVFRSRSYHGATLGMLSFSGDPRREAFEPLLPDGVKWEDPYSAEPCAGDLEDLLRRTGPDTVAAVLLEGVVGANGVYIPPPGYWRRVREICDRHGVLLIADEVLSGFGRTGRWFAVDHDGISPDILTCAKGLTAGYAPGGAAIISARVARHFDDHFLSCGLTVYAHPLTCAAIVAAIDAYNGGKLMERATELGRALRERLMGLPGSRSGIVVLRGIGLLWVAELSEPLGAGPATPARMKRLAGELRRVHLHVHKRDNMVFIAPPLVVTAEDLAQGVSRLQLAIEAAWRD